MFLFWWLSVVFEFLLWRFELLLRRLVVIVMPPLRHFELPFWLSVSVSGLLSRLGRIQFIPQGVAFSGMNCATWWTVHGLTCVV